MRPPLPTVLRLASPLLMFAHRGRFCHMNTWDPQQRTCEASSPGGGGEEEEDQSQVEALPGRRAGGRGAWGGPRSAHDAQVHAQLGTRTVERVKVRPSVFPARTRSRV